MGLSTCIYYQFVNIVAFHGRGGPLVITEAHTSPMEFLHRSAAIEKGLPVIDCNGFNQIGEQAQKPVNY